MNEKGWVGRTYRDIDHNRGEEKCDRCDEIQTIHDSAHGIEDCIRTLTDRLNALTGRQP